MTLSWRRSSRTRSLHHARLLLGLTLLCAGPVLIPAHAQAPAEDALSQKEVDLLRDTADDPSARIEAFEQFLNDRQRRITELVAKRHGHTDYGGDMHDALDQFGAIADELNDNLDEYVHQHRDIRKVLPKLQQLATQWVATLGNPTDNEAYKIVRRIAVDNVHDTQTIVEGARVDLDAYFKAHPEAAKLEKERRANPHAVRPE